MKDYILQSGITALSVVAVALAAAAFQSRNEVILAAMIKATRSIPAAAANLSASGCHYK